MPPARSSRGNGLIVAVGCELANDSEFTARQQLGKTAFDLMTMCEPFREIDVVERQALTSSAHGPCASFERRMPRRRGLFIG